MKGYVITIMHNEHSVKCAERCIETARRSGEMDVEMYPAITPADNPIKLAEELGIDTQRFNEPYSRFENCLSAFLSHHSLWTECLNQNRPIVIFEHDAVVFDYVPVHTPFMGVMNIGQPSYGRWDRPMHLGVGPLTTKKYFPGAHAYMVSPTGAKQLVDKSKTHAKPTDIFLNLGNFPWLQEYYPFVAKADDSFTTIQNKNGCTAKHNYNDSYRIM